MYIFMFILVETKTRESYDWEWRIFGENGWKMVEATDKLQITKHVHLNVAWLCIYIQIKPKGASIW